MLPFLWLRKQPLGPAGFAVRAAPTTGRSGRRAVPGTRSEATMMSPELSAKIVRLYTQEKWKIHTIVTQLQVHHTTVENALRQGGVDPSVSSRPSLADPFIPSRCFFPWLPYHRRGPRHPPLRWTRTAMPRFPISTPRFFSGSRSFFRLGVPPFKPAAWAPPSSLLSCALHRIAAGSARRQHSARFSVMRAFSME